MACLGCILAAFADTLASGDAPEIREAYPYYPALKPSCNSVNIAAANRIMSTKIELTDSIRDVLFKMSEGNPGALTAIMNILEYCEQIDPDNALGGLGVILSLDSLGVRGSKIWMLYKDVCESDLSQMLALLRGHQLGYLTDQQVRHAVENHGDGINVPDICAKVVERLPRFKLNLNQTS